MLFKISRDIERRRASPDMDLYDYVVAADDDGVHAWSRQEKTVETVWMPYEDITGIRLYQRLLHGVCTIYGESAQLCLPYNTVSADVMWRFADLVRQSYSGAGSTTLRGDPDLRETDIDIWLYNQMRDLRERGMDFSIDAYQPCWDDLRTDRRLPWKRKEEFAGTLYLHNDRELLLLRSGKPEKKGEQTYSAEFTSIPWKALKGVSLENSPITNTRSWRGSACRERRSRRRSSRRGGEPSLFWKRLPLRKIENRREQAAACSRFWEKRKARTKVRAFCLYNQTALVTLPERIHRVQTYTWRGEPLTIAFTRFTLGFQGRLERR